MAHGDFKDLARRTASVKSSRDKAFKIASDPKYDSYQRGLASSGSGITTFANKFTFNNEIKQNIQLADELHKPIIRKVF